MDIYEVLFFHPKGTRFLIQGVQADVEQKMEYITQDTLQRKQKHSVPGKHYLDITLTIPRPADDYLVDELRFQTEAEELLLYFKDVHPCLIKGRITDVHLGHGEVTIKFIGNTTDKTYDDFVIEAKNYQSILFGTDYVDDLPIKKKKKIIKRKLTF